MAKGHFMAQNTLFFIISPHFDQLFALSSLKQTVERIFAAHFSNAIKSASETFHTQRTFKFQWNRNENFDRKFVQPSIGQ